MEEVLGALLDFVLVILVLVLIAAVVTVVIQVVKIYENTPPPPPPAPQTNITAELYTEYYSSNYTVYGQIAPTYGPVHTNGFIGFGAVELNNCGFPLQYGVDINTNPWVAIAGQNIPQNEIGYVNTDVDTTNEYQFTITINGIGTIVYTTSNTNPDDEELAFTNGSQVLTNMAGDTEAYNSEPYPQSTNAVIIMRSTNLVTWQNIYTDYVSPGEISYYTDTNIFYGTSTSYYNTNGSGGGGGTSPGTNTIGTNVVVSTPGGAFYMLAYPSNQSDYFSP